MNKIYLDIQCPPLEVVIGRRGENEATAVRIDCTAFRALYGEGEAVLLHQRSKDDVPYTVPTVQEGSTLEWRVTREDTAHPGIGYAQLCWYRNEELAKSVVLRTKVRPSLSDATEPPETAPSALDILAQQWMEANRALRIMKGVSYRRLDWVSGTRYNMHTGLPEARETSQCIGPFTLENAKYCIKDRTRALTYFDILEWDENGDYIGCRETGATASEILFAAHPKHRYALNINDTRNLPENITLSKEDGTGSVPVTVTLDGATPWQQNGSDIFLDITDMLTAAYPSVGPGELNALIGRTSQTAYFWENGYGSASYLGNSGVPSFEISYFTGNRCLLKLNHISTVAQAEEYFTAHPTVFTVNGEDETYYLENLLEEKQDALTLDSTLQWKDGVLSSNTGRTPLSIDNSIEISSLADGGYDIIRGGTVKNSALGATAKIEVANGDLLFKSDDSLTVIGSTGNNYICYTEDEMWDACYLPTYGEVEVMLEESLAEKEKKWNYLAHASTHLTATDHTVFTASGTKKVIVVPNGFSGQCRIILTTSSTTPDIQFEGNLLFQNGIKPVFGANETWEISIFGNRVSYQKYGAVSE